MTIKKIVVGSAQFGMHYGIANQTGQIPTQEIAKILAKAEAMQIRQIDTASAYGESEKVLGQCANHHFDVITKLAPFSDGLENIHLYVKNAYFASLQRLCRNTCAGLLVHRAADLLGEQGDKIYAALAELKAENYVQKIGVSVYSPDQVYALMDRFQLDIIQFPFNLFDQRFLQNGLFALLKQNGITLYARSVFLQGLLLINPHKLSNYFAKFQPLLLALHAESQSQGLTVRQALIEFVLSIKEIDHVIFGIDNYQQFNEIIDDVLVTQNVCRIEATRYRCDDDLLINPMHWKIT